MAKILAQLPDSWVIRWGYYYDKDREGDFLILGPTGGVLVLEVKGGPLRHLAANGRWDGPRRDHPLMQLGSECGAVVDRLTRLGEKRVAPYVTKALCLPDIQLGPGQPAYKGIDRQFIVTGPDLADFETTWQRLFGAHRANVPKPAVEVFMEAYGWEIKPKNIRHFVSETDEILLRHATAEFELLDMLHENRQVLVHGGPGTGKTWLAFEQAYRLAERPPGQRVLLLCYNLALAHTLEQMAAKRHPRCGEIVVRSWESLAREIYRQGGLKWKEPADYEARCQFFAEEVPSMMWRIVAEKRCMPGFDALVMDEAQDHDTQFTRGGDGADGIGWWEIYLKLLRAGLEAPISVFYDPGQRPLFRDPAGFDVERLRGRLRQAVHVRLLNALRYTRPVFRFLKGLRSDATASLVDELRHRGYLPDGPDVEVHSAGAGRTAEVVRDIVIRWISDGYCRADNILVLSPHSQQQKTGLAGADRVGAWPLASHENRAPGQVSLLSVNKAKGLDSLGVILIDLRPFDALADDQERMDYFMGASRARQLLAVVHRED